MGFFLPATRTRLEILSGDTGGRMSNYLAIAVVTATLQGILQRAVSEAVPGARVRVGIPKYPSDPGGAEVSLYLYHVTPNPFLRNESLPWRASGGNLRQAPVVPLDLHYMVSFFGEERLESERMMGCVLGVLGAEQIISRELIDQTIQSSSWLELKESDLANEVDRIKVTPQYLSLDELSKLWTVLPQSTLRPSLQYRVSPLLILTDAGDGSTITAVTP